MATDTQSAGATPVVEGATPPQNPPAQPAAAHTDVQQPPATGADELGDAGKRALSAERKRADDAEKAHKALQAQFEELQNANRSEQEKALAAAKKEGAAEVEQRYQAQLRAAKVESALVAAGCTDPALAVLAPDFASLTISADGRVDGLGAALEAFKGGHPTLFTPSTPTGSADGGARGGGGLPTFKESQLNDRVFYEANEAEINAAIREHRIVEG